MEEPFREPGLSPDDRLIETLGWTGREIARLALHLDRLAASAAALGFACDRGRAAAALERIAQGAAPLRLRLTLARDGVLEATAQPMAPAPEEWRVALAPRRIASDDPLRGHKTTARGLYDRGRAALPAGIDELLYVNAAGRLVEGTITTLFFDLGQGPCTPPLAEGCLPGVLRRALLDAGRVQEAPLPLDQLAAARLWCGNSLRGLIPARLA
ncbi:aminotransferase class IV [Frigidibacter sp. MR17.14]|uniref:aminotransferase class IV n=1 Tax=Frigidibacter sp. MR17.14 TaxID=3126509 RepID=UPI003012F88F